MLAVLERRFVQANRALLIVLLTAMVVVTSSMSFCAMPASRHFCGEKKSGVT